MDAPLTPPRAADPARKQMNSEALKMGLMMGGLMIAYSLVLHFSGMVTNRSLGWIVYALVFAGMFLGTKNYRDNFMGGTMTFGQAFGMSFRILLYAALLYAVYSYIYFKTFGHDTLGVMRDTMMEELDKAGVSESQAEQMMEMYRKWVFIPGAMAISAFLGTLLIGSLLGLINAAILKRLPEQLEPPMP